MNERDKERQEIAKRQLINLLRRKGTIITVVEGHNDLQKGFDDYDLPIVYGITTKFSIQLAYKKHTP